MSDFDSKLNAFFAKLDHKLQKDFPDVLAETAIAHFKESFKTKSFDGVAWKPYKYPAREPSRGSLMNRSPGGLAHSIGERTIITANRVTIYAGKPYARIHNEGGRVRQIKNVRPYHNNNFMGKGKRVQIQAHAYKVDYTMPQRQFMGKSTSLLNAIENRFKTNFKDL